MATRRTKSRARRVLGVVGSVVGTTVVFVAATAVAVRIHLDHPVMRRIVLTQVNAVLHDQFAGEVTVERIGSLGLGGVSGVRVRVKDPRGLQVIYADGVTVRVRTAVAARSFLLGRGDVVVTAPVVSIDDADVAIDGDADGNVRIANAFAPRTPSPATPSNPNARGVRVDAPSVRLAHAWVHGAAPGAPRLDADLNGLAGRAHYDGALITADLEHVDLVTRGLPRSVDPKGRIAGHFAMPSASGEGVAVDASFEGSVAGAATTAHAVMNGQHVDAVIDGHDPTGAGVRAAFPELVVHDDTTLHAEVHGELPKLVAKAHLAAGRATIDVDGTIDVSDGTRASATIAVRDVDAHALVARAPVSAAGLDATVNVAIARGGAMSGTFTATTLRGTAAGQRLPIAKLQGTFTKETAHVTARVTDPRGTADVVANLSTASGSTVVDAQVRGNVPDLARIPEIGGAMKGSAIVTAQGTANLTESTVRGSARVEGRDVAYGAASVDRVTVVATAEGPLDRPVVDVDVQSGLIASSAKKLGIASVHGRVVPGEITIITNAHADVVRRGGTVSLSARRVEIGPRLVVDGGVVDGLGAPIGVEVTKDASVLRVKLDAPSVDLARVAAFAGKPHAVAAGQLAMKGDVAFRRDGTTGELHAAIDGLSTMQMDGGKAGLDATFTGNALKLDLTSELGKVGSVRVAAREIKLAGSALDVASWERARGKLTIDAALDLKEASGLVPPELLPLKDVRGTLAIAGAIVRREPDNLPDVRVHAQTSGFGFALKPAARATQGTTTPPVAAPAASASPWRVDGVDVALDVNADAASGYTDVGVGLINGAGMLAFLNVKADLPFKHIYEHPERAKRIAEHVPASVRLVVPQRDLTDLPAFLGTRAIPGTVFADLSIAGTALDPRLDFVARSRGVRSGALVEGMESNTDVTLTYDGDAADLVAKMGAEKHDALAMSAHVDVKARDLLERGDAPLAWDGSAKVKLSRFPLHSVQSIARKRVRGHVSGEVVLADLHEDAQLHANIKVDELKIARSTYDSGTIVLDAEDGKVGARATLHQTDGYADLQATTGMRWGSALVPALDPAASTEARLTANGFQAGAILPFARGVLNSLDGRIDANVAVKTGPAFGTPVMDGKIVFHDGSLQLTALGDEFKDARASVSFQPGGVIKIEDVYMRAVDGEVTADAQIKTKGLGFDSATASLHIPTKKPIDLSMQGQAFGAVSADVKASAVKSPDGKQINVNVDVPTVAVVLPQKLKSGLQELTREPNVRAGTVNADGTFVTLPLDRHDLKPEEEQTAGTVLDVDVKIGEATISQGTQAKVVLGGNPHIRVAATTGITGQLQLKEGGKVDVQGKEFEIQPGGTITFQPEDPTNPIIVATASWNADDGSTVFADFVGPVKTGKVNLRSDPSRPKNEVLALIVFGTADGASSSSASPNAATSLGGGIAAQGLTEAMDDLTGIQATARIDTSRSANPAPELEIQIARRLSLAFEHVLGVPPISEPDVNLATVDWRFRANWSIETTFGDHGKIQTDAVWTKRY